MVVIKFLQGNAEDPAVQVCHRHLRGPAGLEAEILVPQHMRLIVHADVGQAPLKQPAGLNELDAGCQY